MINILDELKDINVGEDELIQDRLTPEQIELEKREFKDSLRKRDMDRLKKRVICVSNQECSQRLNGKTHYVSSVYFSPSIRDAFPYHQAQIHCEFCGQVDFVFIEKNLQEGRISE